MHTNRSNQLPKLPEPSSNESQLSTLNQLLVKKFQLEGNTLFTDEELNKIVAIYENRPVSAAELHELTQKLTTFYVQKGFVNSGVILPDQKIKNNTVVLQVIEGELSDIQLSGNRYLSERYIQKRLGNTHGQAFNVNKLQYRLSKLQQDPRIGRIQANIKPGAQRGQAILDMRIDENKPYLFGFSLSNHISPNVGPYKAELDFDHINLSGIGDTLSVDYSNAEGLDDTVLYYSVPVSRRDTLISFSYQKSDSTVVAKPFDLLNISGKSTRTSISMRQPIIDNLISEFALGLSANKRRNESFFEGAPFSFTAGTNNGRSDATVVSLSQEWVYRSNRSVLAVYSSFDFGTEDQGVNTPNNPITFSAATAPEPPTGKFNAWLGQLQWLRRFETFNSLLVLRNRFQLSADPLFASEQFSLGGSESVRGYRENLITRDNGVLISLEWRIPILQSAVATQGRAVELAPFIDYGQGWNTQNSRSSELDISSTGISLRWNPGPKYRLRLDIAEALDDDIGNFPESNIQDDGIHLEFRVEL